MKVYVMRTQYWIVDYHYFLQHEDFAVFSSVINARSAMLDEAKSCCEKRKDEGDNPETKRNSMDSVTIDNGQEEIRYNIFELPVRS